MGTTVGRRAGLALTEPRNAPAAPPARRPMPEFQRLVTIYRCARCAWEWIARTKRRPTICPHCKSPYWDRERERPRRASPAPSEGAP